MENLLLKNLPFNSQVGVIGHELSHTVYYLNRNFVQITGVGIHYFFPKFRGRFEKDTDIRTINHGMGWLLYDFAKFVRALPDMQQHEDWIDKFYLNHYEIIEYMKVIPDYKMIDNG